MLSESGIQQQIVMWYNNTYCLSTNPNRGMIFHVPNQNQYKLTAIGVMSGVSDLVVMLPKSHTDASGRIIFVEVKDNRGKQSDKQIDFECRVNELGHPYYVVRSLDEFKKIIEKYILLKQ